MQQRSTDSLPGSPRGFWSMCIGWAMNHRTFVTAAVVLVCGLGLYVAPFARDFGFPRSPIAVGALPESSDHQQYILTEWPDYSPGDIEDQITAPLTSALMGLPRVKRVRSTSAFGFSSISVVFDEDVDPYWARSRILERLTTLSKNALPDGVRPTLGPDATPLGQVFWYTLEGRDEHGRPTDGWSQEELRRAQDVIVRPSLESVTDVSEIGSIGGFEREYHVDVNPDALRAHGLTMPQVVRAIRDSNRDIGARTMEINGVEYIVRGLGQIKDLDALAQTVVAVRHGVAIRLRDIGHVTWGPASRRGLLNDGGTPAVGGVVVARQGANPQVLIDAVKDKIERLQASLPRKELEGIGTSQVTIVPFYDRGALISNAMATLSTALMHQFMVTLIVVVVLMRSLRAPLLVAALLPISTLSCFVGMWALGIEANLLSLAGLVLALGSVVDVGIVLVDNILQHLSRTPHAERAQIVFRASCEIVPAIMTSSMTTVVTFLVLFCLPRPELRVFGPLAVTKTLAMLAALVLVIVLLPPWAPTILTRRTFTAPRVQRLLAASVLLMAVASPWWTGTTKNVAASLPLIVVGLSTISILIGFTLFEAIYPRLLRTLLVSKRAFLALAAAVVLVGGLAWFGAPSLLGWMPEDIRTSRGGRLLDRHFPGLRSEYMPMLDEGDFLYMPTTVAHGSIEEIEKLLASTSAAIADIPEVDRVVGKAGRVDSALDPAPLSMLETLVSYRPEYGTNEHGQRVRQWRPHIRSPSDIWQEIERAAATPGLTSAPRLMPIEARRVMLQTSVKGELGLRVTAPSLPDVERLARDLAATLPSIRGVDANSVIVDDPGDKLYVEVDFDSELLGQHGLLLADAAAQLESAVGGVIASTSIQGSERFPIRVRYQRESRDRMSALRGLVLYTQQRRPVQLVDVADIRVVRRPRVIRSEDGFATLYVLFERDRSFGLNKVAASISSRLRDKMNSMDIHVPPGATFSLTGTYEDYLRSMMRLSLIVPVAILIVLFLLWIQFRRLSTSLIIFSGVIVAIAGGLILMWLFGQPWFLDCSLMGVSLREVFQIRPVALSTAVWVGFIALVGLATDDGVVVSTYFQQRLADCPPSDRHDLHRLAVEAGCRRIRACLTTTATTLLALLTIVISKGTGSDLMAPMVLPIVGGMTVALMTLFVVPILSVAWEERRLHGH